MRIATLLVEAECHSGSAEKQSHPRYPEYGEKSINCRRHVHPTYAIASRSALAQRKADNVLLAGHWVRSPPLRNLSQDFVPSTPALDLLSPELLYFEGK